VTRNISPQYSGQVLQAPYDETRRTVTCVICQAVYVPSQGCEYLALTSSIALESALMSMSHFCFRCRRPACPQCWDEMHGVCGACAQDAHLPFRSASAPLSGTLFTASPQTQGQSKHKLSPLICIRYGKFQRPPTLTKKRVTSSVRLHRPDVLSVPQPARKAVAHVTTGRITRELSPLSHDDIAEVDTQPVRHEDNIIELDTQPAFRRSIWQRVEHVLTVCMTLILVLLLTTILLALVFPTVNIFVAATLHIDIQAEIAYLLQLITHLH
jgi:hypothetical protein